MSSLEPFYDFDHFLRDALSSRLAANESALQRRALEDGVKPGEGAVRHLKPRMDLHENLDENVVTATFELPGLKKEDVQIDVNNNRLSIYGEAKQSEEHEEKGYAVKERRYGKFSRNLQLPPGQKDIKASLDNGILTVIFPKMTMEQAPKKITID
ncbi:small heat shock protein [Gymnopilus junonius]|uniref:Small heat shock protein n=1 Tax=Gymnopilus junonius TaxID=109634 RepID=A0A9P5P0W2_GYMJU|nr:small heat shock protein [Gymnopilus junonius]